MLNITEATTVVTKNLPGWKIQRATPFKKVWTLTTQLIEKLEAKGKEHRYEYMG